MGLDSSKMEEPAKPKRGVGMAKFLIVLLKVILGLIFLGLGAWAILKWWDFLLVILKGSAGLLLLLAGVITLVLAKE